VRVDRRQVFGAVADERRGVAALIDSLDAAQLATPSLCVGWDVKTVAAHLVSVFDDSFWSFQWTAVRGGGIHRAIDELARKRAGWPASKIATALRGGADRELSPPITGPLSGLTDVLVHSGDMKVPLGVPFEPNRERVALALDFLTSRRALGFVPRGRLRGITLQGDDVGRSWGSGGEVRGPVRALMMIACARTALVHELQGSGLPILISRVSR
jgi:uncharacterized protein (TIGR03083 family)